MSCLRYVDHGQPMSHHGPYMSLSRVSYSDRFKLEIRFTNREAFINYDFIWTKQKIELIHAEMKTIG